MITAHANSGIDALHAALTSADTQLEHISNRLQSEFSINHPDTSTNPFTLLHRLRSLQAHLPALKEQLLTIHQQKAQLVTQCRTHIHENTRFARYVLPVAVPAGDDPSSFEEQFKRTESDLSALLADFRTVNAAFVERADVTDQELNLALLRAVADVNLTPEQSKENAPERNIETPAGGQVEGKTTAAKQPFKSDKGSTGREKTSGRKKVVVKSPNKEFVPVSKVVYNRLPRVLKIKAGKLPQINEFYEKVFSALCDHTTPLSDAELREATGEDDMTKFEVLRGLAVLRHSKQGWMLAG